MPGVRSCCIERVYGKRDKKIVKRADEYVISYSVTDLSAEKQKARRVLFTEPLFYSDNAHSFVQSLSQIPSVVDDISITATATAWIFQH